MMALTQSVLRLPGPSWDEEVVPALRKRLESESRTLSKRMSAISLSGDDSTPTFPTFTESASRQNTGIFPATQPSSAGNTRFQQVYQQPEPANSNSTATPHSNPNPATKPSTLSNYQRSRTYSQPDTSHLPNGTVNGKTPRSTKGSSTSKSSKASRSRPAELKPTRIPKASRPSLGAYPSVSNDNTPTIPQTNGFASNHYATVTSSGQYIPEPPEMKGYQGMTVSSTRSTVGIPARPTPGLLNESPPFPTSSSMSSIEHSPNERDEPGEEPRRGSTESEERPFEHWYRGEVSRNGGVGELRVGKRQEMLEIANYGYAIGNKKQKISPDWSQTPHHYRYQTEDSRRHRRRAGSTGGFTNKERERGSLYLDDEDVNKVGLVLDEHPLTDLDGDMSDIGSLSSQHRHEHHYFPAARGASSPTDTIPETFSIDNTADRSTTPIPASQSSRNGQYPPTRIPGPSSRRSSESRAVTPTFNNARLVNGSSSSSQTPSPPPIPTPAMRQVSGQSTSSTTVHGKRGVSPASGLAKKRTPVKSLRGKQAPSAAVKKAMANADHRTSVAYYPSPGDGDGGDMADAIPSWTQPVPKEGNWDEVVLPVVARKKGMDGHYETADGSPQQSKKAQAVAPAPGTFGYDHSKYRPPRNEGQPIPMDEFGRPGKETLEEDADLERENRDSDRQPYNEIPSKHDETRLPVRHPPSPAPFAQYAPIKDKMVTLVPTIGQAEIGRIHDVEEKGAGCCKCVIM